MPISKRDYLQKYLDDSDTKKKKKKKKKSKHLKGNSVKVVDADYEVTASHNPEQPKSLYDEDEYQPVVVSSKEIPSNSIEQTNELEGATIVGFTDETKQQQDHASQRKRNNDSDSDSDILGKRKRRRYDSSDEESDNQLYSKNDDDDVIPSNLSGKSATTVYRDKYGRKVERSDKISKLNKKRKRNQTETDEESKMIWGGGMAQDEEQVDIKARLKEEKTKPFAQYENNPELEAKRKETELWGDPMAGLIKRDKKKKKKKKKNRPEYTGPPPPPNRFGIMPGHRWDGVDRSNGFEKRLFLRESENKSLADMAYKYSVAEM